MVGFDARHSERASSFLFSNYLALLCPFQFFYSQENKKTATVAAERGRILVGEIEKEGGIPPTRLRASGVAKEKK